MNIRLLEKNSIEIESQKKLLVLEASKDHPGALVLTNSVENAVKSQKSRVIDWPGEYELGSWHFKSIDVGNQRCLITVRIEELKLTHLGKSKDLTEEQIDKLGDIDVLILEVGEEAMDLKTAEKIVKDIDPRSVIPLGKEATSLIKALGAETEESVKLKISKSSLPLDKTEIYHLVSA